MINLFGYIHIHATASQWLNLGYTLLAWVLRASPHSSVRSWLLLVETQLDQVREEVHVQVSTCMVLYSTSSCFQVQHLFTCQNFASDNNLYPSSELLPHCLPLSTGDAVVNVYINQEKRFAFVEMRTVEEASNAMSLDGIIYEVL